MTQSIGAGKKLPGRCLPVDHRRYHSGSRSRVQERISCATAAFPTDDKTQP